MSVKTANIYIVEVENINEGCKSTFKTVHGNRDLVTLDAERGRYKLAELKKAIEELETFNKEELEKEMQPGEEGFDIGPVNIP